MSQSPPSKETHDHAHPSPGERVFNALLMLFIAGMLVAGMYSARGPREGAEGAEPEHGATEASPHGGGAEPAAAEHGKEPHGEQAPAAEGK
jgi:hypothetical protein